MKQPAINELVSLLSDFDNNKLLELKDNNPELKEIFKLGQTLGDETEDENEEIEKQRIKELKVRVEVCGAALKIVVTKCNELMPKLKTKLSRLNNLQLISQIIILISGATLISIIEKNVGAPIKYLVASLTLVSSLLTLITKHLSGTIIPSEKNLYQVHEALVDERTKAEHSISEIDILKQFDSKDTIARLSEIINIGNRSSMKLRRLMEKA